MSSAATPIRLLAVARGAASTAVVSAASPWTAFSGAGAVALRPVLPPITSEASLDLSGADDVIWDKVPGVTPFVSEITSARWRVEDFSDAFAGREVALDFAGRTFRRLRLLRVFQPSPINCTLRIADRRVDWRQEKLYCRANMRRRVAERTAIADLRSVEGNRYRDWSLKGADGGEKDVWTAKELLLHLLVVTARQADHLVATATPAAAGVDLSNAGSLRDNGQVPSNFETWGDPAPDVLARLCRFAELQIGIRDDGTIYVYDPYDSAPVAFPDSIAGGAMRKVSNARMRPKKITVTFAVERERKYTYSRTNTDPHKIVNVLPLPHDTTISGKVVPMGSIVRMSDALTAWGIAEDDVRLACPGGVMILAVKYGRRGDQIDPVVLSRAQVLVSHYLQTWQIDAASLTDILSWSPTTVEVVDPTTGARRPSPVFTIWFDLFTVYSAWLLPQRGKFGEDGNSFTTSPAVAGPFQAVPFGHPDLGVFRVESLALVDGIVERRWPFGFERTPSNFRTADNPTSILGQCAASPNHRLEVVITVETGKPNGKSGVHHEVRDFTEHGGVVEELTIHHPYETAKFAVNGSMVNAGLIAAIADAESIAVMTSYLDRPQGILTVVHRPSDAWELNSHCKGIRFQRSESAGDSVTLDYGETPPKPDFMRYMTQTHRAFLQRLTRSDAN
jgi:hypothetical protein